MSDFLTSIQKLFAVPEASQYCVERGSNNLFHVYIKMPDGQKFEGEHQEMLTAAQLALEQHEAHLLLLALANTKVEWVENYAADCVREHRNDL
jgi:hypothetical protein